MFSKAFDSIDTKNDRSVNLWDDLMLAVNNQNAKKNVDESEKEYSGCIYK